MDQNQFRNLYLEEIELYKQQIESLKNGNRQSEEKNAALVSQIRDLESLIEKAAVANKDLNQAFEHMVLENRRLQQLTNQQNPETRAIQSSEDLGLQRVNDFNTQVEESRGKNRNLEAQYFDLARNSVSWLSEKERMVQRIKFLERECDRYNRDNTTLGKQVRHLLRSLEEERGMIIRRQRDVESLTCAADVIDEHLVTFESIEQLQQQNQKLLSLVKDLSARQEERETVLENDEIKRLTQDIKDLRSKLDKAESDRENVLNALNTLYKERDLFKILLSKTRDVEHMTPEIFQRMVTVAVSSGPAITNVAESSLEKDMQIDHLKDTISRLEHQIAELKNDLKESRLKSEEELRLKGELLEEAHMKILTESQRADTLKDRVQVLEGNITALTSEFDETRTKYQKASFEVEQKQKSIDGLEISLKAISTEMEDFKLKYHKTCFELEDLKTQQQNLSSEVEQKQQSIEFLEGTIMSLNQELDDLKSRYMQATQEVEQKQSLINDLENHIKDLTAELDDTRTKYQSAVLEAEQKQQSIDGLENTIKIPNAELNDIQAKYQLALAELEQKQLFISELETKIKIAMTELEDARNKYHEAHTQLEQKQMTIEELERERQVTKQEQAPFNDVQLEERQETIRVMESQLKNLERELVGLRQDFIYMQDLRSFERSQRLKLLKRSKSRFVVRVRPSKASPPKEPIIHESPIKIEKPVENIPVETTPPPPPPPPPPPQATEKRFTLKRRNLE